MKQFSGELKLNLWLAVMSVISIMHGAAIGSIVGVSFPLEDLSRGKIFSFVGFLIFGSIYILILTLTPLFYDKFSNILKVNIAQIFLGILISSAGGFVTERPLAISITLASWWIAANLVLIFCVSVLEKMNEGKNDGR